MITIDVLGVGGGATAAYTGEASSSFIFSIDDSFQLLLDAGYGCIRSCLKLNGSIPRHIYISHNHSDHSGELPVLLAVENRQKALTTVYAERQVMQRLKEHRLHELLSAISGTSGVSGDNGGSAPCPFERFAHLVPLEEEASFAVRSRHVDLALIPVRSRHSELCFGLIVTLGGVPILGWTGDSGRDEILEARLADCGSILVDARASGSAEHMGFDDIERLAKSTWAGKRIYVYGYGTQADLRGFGSETPSGVSVLVPGERIQIQIPGLHSRPRSSCGPEAVVAADGEPPCTSEETRMEIKS